MRIKRDIIARVALSLAIASPGAIGCATGLVDDAPASDRPATRDPKATEVPQNLGDASRPDTSEAADGAIVASNDGSTPEAAAEGGVVVTPPVVDGNIQSGEYGVHTDGQNKQTFDPADPLSTTWYMTWTETTLYVGVTGANIAEGLVIYLDHAPLTPSTSGTSADGSLVGVPYDNAKLASLPLRADFVLYAKGTYNEYRTANGANGWSAPTVGAITFQGNGLSRELAIPWSLIHPGGRPASFAWLGYAGSAGGYVYGPMPPDNAVGMVGQNAWFNSHYEVIDATPGTGTRPFAVKLSP